MRSLSIALLCGLCLARPGYGAELELEVVAGQDASGRPTGRWIEAIRYYNDETSLARIATSEKPYTAEEEDWRALIVAHSVSWPSEVPMLSIPFEGIEPPASVELLLGNVGGSDAFVENDRHIAFDLSRLQSVYGDASTPVNSDRIDRLFRHEYTHLIHKEWRRVRGLEITTPLEQALWVCLTEGIGNYRSLSARWTNADGSLSAHAESVLSRLSPILVDRLSRLEHANPEEAIELAKGLAMGPFEQKWGALPVALWMSQEARNGDEALRVWVEAGPWGIVDLAAKYLPAELAGRLPRPPG